jgi:hypothetical protein
MNESDMLTLTDFDTALRWHLQSNHFPPVPIEMMGPCNEAIDAANEDDWGRLIDLPENTSYRGRSQAPAWAIVEAHHLSGFLEEE